MSHRWTHVLCRACYEELEPGRIPTVIPADDEVQPCCYCGEETDVRIFYRADPTIMLCSGEESDDV